MAERNEILKWASQLNASGRFRGVRARRQACERLAAEGSASAVPFLVSALANSDEQVRRVAESGLSALSDPDVIDAVALGYAFTGSKTLSRILESLGRQVPESVELSTVEPSPAESAWRIRNEKDGTVLAFVPEGEFQAGKEEFSVHLPPYYLALTCVSNNQCCRFLNEQKPSSATLAGWIMLDSASPIRQTGGAYVADPEKADLPAAGVLWQGAEAYCRWAGLRLPTELEWEKGARGVDGRLYPWGDDWSAGRPPPPQGDRRPEELVSIDAFPTARSPYGLYQMIGGVFEWCADWYDEGSYARYARGDLKPPARGETRALRGGPWRFGAPAYIGTPYRKSTVWPVGTLLCGARCAKTP